MALYFIKKALRASSAIEALKNESSADVIEVWQDKPETSYEECRPAMGFEFYPNNPPPASGMEARTKKRR